MNTDINKLAEQIAKLTDAQALDLLSSIEGLTARAAAYKEARARAEARRDEVAAMCVCSCGQPAKFARWSSWSSGAIQVGLCRDSMQGGLIMEYNGQEDKPGDKDTDINGIENDLWVLCDSRECDWTRIKNGLKLVVDWQ